jgi:hypothetical protein
MTQRAGDGNRTRDPELGRLVLYQLSYSRAAGRAGPTHQHRQYGEGRIRTSEGVRRQIYSLLPLAARAPLRGRCRRMDPWSRWSESNRRPADYKSAALPPELHRQGGTELPRVRRLSFKEVISGIPPASVRRARASAHRLPDGRVPNVTKPQLITFGPRTVNKSGARAGDYRSCPVFRQSSNRATPAATETFSDSTPAAMGIRTSKSQVRRTSARNPSPSPPTTRPTRSS